jgi:hypothetical protein
VRGADAVALCPGASELVRPDGLGPTRHRAQRAAPSLSDADVDEVLGVVLAQAPLLPQRELGRDGHAERGQALVEPRRDGGLDGEHERAEERGRLGGVREEDVEGGQRGSLRSAVTPRTSYCNYIAFESEMLLQEDLVTEGIDGMTEAGIGPGMRALDVGCGSSADLRGQPIVQRGEHAAAAGALAEALGTMLLLATVVGSGIMGDELDGGIEAVGLLADTLATGAGLVAYITVLGPISGAHYNPAVSLVERLRGKLDNTELAAYVGAQLAGGVVGVLLAHAMFALPRLRLSVHVRTGAGQ